MRSGIRGLITGALVLVTLQTVVQPAAAGRVGDLLGLPAAAAKRFLDPTIPAIPARVEREDLREPQVGDGIGGGLVRGGGPPTTRYPDPWAPPTISGGNR